MDKLPYILIAEDNADHFELIREALKEGGFPVEYVWVRDGEELLQHLSQGRLPNLILLDLNLPRKDGREVLRIIKRTVRLRCIPIIVLTTSGSPQDVSLAYELGANAFMRKPPGFAALTDLMKSWAVFWLRCVELPPYNEDPSSGERLN